MKNNLDILIQNSLTILRASPNILLKRFSYVKCTILFMSMYICFFQIQLMLHFQARPINLFQKKFKSSKNFFSSFFVVFSKISRFCAHFLRCYNLSLFKMWFQRQLKLQTTTLLEKPHKIFSAILKIQFSYDNKMTLLALYKEVQHKLPTFASK